MATGGSGSEGSPVVFGPLLVWLAVGYWLFFGAAWFRIHSTSLDLGSLR